MKISIENQNPEESAREKEFWEIISILFAVTVTWHTRAQMGLQKVKKGSRYREEEIS